MAGDALPQSDPGREFALKRMEDSGELDRSKYDTTAPNELLLRLQRTTPYYKAGRAAPAPASGPWPPPLPVHDCRLCLRPVAAGALVAASLDPIQLLLLPEGPSEASNARSR